MAASDAAEETVKYTVTYFDIPLRAEAIRATLQIGGEVYTDNRVAFSDWAELKATTRWGSLPTLTLEDGTVLCQSHNILRHVGRMTGYYPFHDLSRAARVDELLAAWYDVVEGVAGAGSGLEGQEKLDARAAVVGENGKASKLLEKLDSAIAEFTDGTYAVGRQLSIADIATWAYSCALSCGALDGVPTDCLEKYENIMKTRFLVAKIPAVKKYLSKYDDEGVYAQYKRRSLSGEDEEEEEEPAAEEVKADDEQAEEAEAPKEAATEVDEPAGGDDIPQTPAVVDEGDGDEEESSKRAPEAEATN